ncbi:hypothetical protein Y032_0128g1428 [Ancylostoma ceylanicum]|nr:hypothetical protein Y032_0128g1428 [Ancylostoma ceylanicum]
MAYRIKHFNYDGLDAIVAQSFEDAATEMRLKDYANRLVGDIREARIRRELRNAQYGGKAVPASAPELSLENCSKKVWRLEADSPFIEVDLRSLALDWRPRAKDNTFQQVASLYRFLVQRITDPPEKIQDYATRINGRFGRDNSLKNLPKPIETTLIDFVEDMLGYGWPEVQTGTVGDPLSRFPF